MKHEVCEDTILGRWLSFKAKLLKMVREGHVHVKPLNMKFEWVKYFKNDNEVSRLQIKPTGKLSALIKNLMAQIKHDPENIKKIRIWKVFK